MTFSQLLHAVRQNPQEMVIPSVWGQGRAGFGGLAVALVFEAMRAKVPAGRPLRSLAVTFVGPLVLDAPVSFEAEVLREGKAVSQVLGRALQDGQVVTLVQGSFGASRASAIDVPALPAPAMKPVAECQELPYIKNVTPEFTRYLAMRWGEGGMPFSNNQSRHMGGWVRLRGSRRAGGAAGGGALAGPGGRLAARRVAAPEGSGRRQLADLDHRVCAAVSGPEQRGLVPVPG